MRLDPRALDGREGAGGVGSVVDGSGNVEGTSEPSRNRREKALNRRFGGIDVFGGWGRTALGP